MRFGVETVVSIALVGGALACSSGGGKSTMPTGADDASVCTDTTPPSPVDDVFNNNAGLACPLDSTYNPLPYDTAIYTSCSTLNLTSGDVKFGECLGYLVWEVDLDATGQNFSKCFYSVTTHALVGVVFGDGTQDQCGNSSYTIQAGSVQACDIAGLSAPGAGGTFEDCKPVPEGGASGG